jgi:hypothetical protein
MKKLLISALLVALSCVPSLGLAGDTRAPHAAVGAVPGVGLAEPVPLDISPGSTRDYAAREAAAPQLAEFAGGSGGIYIGTGALVVALVVVVVILVLR